MLTEISPKMLRALYGMIQSLLQEVEQIGLTVNDYNLCMVN
jgi:hypothetical protein